MIYYYKSYDEDFVKTKNQAKKIPEDYKWIKTNPFQILFGSIMFYILKLVGLIYGKCAFSLKIIGQEKIRDYRYSAKTRNNSQKFAKLGGAGLNSMGGYYIYANHTLPLGDVFNPALYNPVRPYYLCDSSNLGIPVLGPILPFVGAMPIPESIRGKKRLFNAISTRAKQGNAIVIYPEAHVWPYYTKIRPFPTSSFNFPVRDNLPIFTATTVFNEPKKAGRRPRVTIYIDGPFMPKAKSPKHELTKKEKIESLHAQAKAQFEKRSQLSDYEYRIYEKVTSAEKKTS